MYRKLGFFLVLLVSSGVASAHHPLAGLPMSTFLHGILSGLGHPVIGIDHLFFVMAVGIGSYYARSPLLSPLFYLIGMVAGIVLIGAGMQLGYVEIVIALSLVLLGVVIISGWSMSTTQSRALFVFFGLFHGYAFGESMVGVESISESVWAGYLIGLCSIQWMIAVLAGYVGSKAWTQLDSMAIRPRLMGAVTLGVGITFVVEITESLLLQTV